MLKRRSLFVKLFFFYVVILLITFVGTNTVSFLLLKNDMFRDRGNFAEARIHTIVRLLNTSAVQRQSKETLLSFLNIAYADQGQTFYTFDRSGKMLYRFGRIPPEDDPQLRDSAYIRGVIHDGVPVDNVMDDEKRGLELFMYLLPIKGEAGMDEALVAMVSYDFPARAAGMRNRFIIPGMISIVVAGIIIFFLSRKLTEPLREMNRKALLLAEGSFDQRIRVRTKDEIGQLGESFNIMAQELGVYDRLQKEFVANVSHDLRSPLTSIHGYLGAMQDGVIPGEKQHHYIKLMRAQTGRMIKLVGDLLDMAKIESGQMEIHPIRYDLTEQVRQTIAAMEPYMAEKGVVAVIAADEDQDVYAYADPDRIAQVLFNLLQNAVQFSHRNGKVDVSVYADKGKAVVSISDYGIGIAEQDLPRIWERYYKQDKARSGMSGTGIGLSIIRHIIDLHRTGIKVESAPGRGTTFTFTLPLEPSPGSGQG